MNKQITKQERINRLKKENLDLRNMICWKQALLNETIRVMENHVLDIEHINKKFGKKEYEEHKGMMKS